MARDAAKPSAGPTAGAQPALPPLPRAWQPLTWRGVAAFVYASSNRLLFVQFLVALLALGAVLWFLNTGWFPLLREAIHQLPDAGAIENQQLSSARTSVEPLVEHRLLSFVVAVERGAPPASSSDLRVTFHSNKVAICSFLGCSTRAYPAGWLPFNRPDLQSWWGAWEPMIYLWVSLGVVTFLFVSWFLLATLYCPFLRLYAFFKDRQLTLMGSWKLAAASLLPGCLLVSAGLVLYGLGLVDLPRFLALWLLHFVLGWVYLLVSPRRLPAASDAARTVRQNPFGEEEEGEEPAASNPFGRAAGTEPAEKPARAE